LTGDKDGQALPAPCQEDIFFAAWSHVGFLLFERVGGRASRSFSWPLASFTPPTLQAVEPPAVDAQ
jgi:hypothetical protein